jgi:hypothetical protein
MLGVENHGAIFGVRKDSDTRDCRMVVSGVQIQRVSTSRLGIPN